MAELDNAIVSLSMYYGKQKLSTGSGVFFKRNGKYFIVTAWHNFSGRHSETLKCLDEINNAIPDHVYVTFRCSYTEGFMGLNTVRLALYNDENALFFRHPDNWPRIDVVALPFDPFNEHTSIFWSVNGESEITRHLGNDAHNGRCCIFTIQDYLSKDESAEHWIKYADVTSEVFIPSYPHNITDYEMKPVWKRATFASKPSQGWDRETKYIIDSASSSGMSGASVFYYDPYGVIRTGNFHVHLDRPAVIFAGIYVGRIGIVKGVDPQVGTVWHPSVVDEIIDGQTYDYHYIETEISPKELEAVILKNLETCSREGIDNILNEKIHSRYFVRTEILKLIKGRASPERVLEDILSLTATYDGPLVPSS